MKQEIIIKDCKLKDCKYRLPCNWCDKYDRMCEAILFKIHKFEQEQEKNAMPKECEHEWYQYVLDYDGERVLIAHVCSKCGEAKVENKQRNK